MSIPPLVCSTPPPPDQCEEDKDPDDFDISYNLTPDDEDDDSFGYGGFASYSNYQSNCISQNNETQCNNVESILIDEAEQENVINNLNNQSTSKADQISLFGTNTTNETPTKGDEETNIEDLCLKVNEDSISPNEREDEKCEVGNYDVEHTETENVIGVAFDEQDTQSSPCNETFVEAKNIEHFKENLDNEPLDDSISDLEIRSNELNPCSIDEVSECDADNKAVTEAAKESNIDDDFGEFDDFQFKSSENKSSGLIDNCDNPWNNSNTANNENNDFGNFTANFDTFEAQNSAVSIEDTFDTEIKENLRTNYSANDNDDDFGDFDDFQSSAVDHLSIESMEESQNEQHLPVINFQMSDTEAQIMDSISKVLSSIFEEEISEPENEFEGKLESMLSETWGHLRETDVRQPYILNWNNSLGQKTLLRALCIDSRNILFGPKWSNNMPKYAVNLSMAPLQPQKPLTPSYTNVSEAVTTEKTTTKPSGWTDPFTADGQESCNTENESVVEVTANDLDVFEAAITSKSDKIYSSTLNVQPLRHISLPDTHIFTPTDSETPTSKTVHYDSGPPILLPPTVLENSKKASTTQHTTNDTPRDSKDDDDYWEFQDFKSGSEKSSDVATTSIAHELPPETKSEPVLKPNITYQTQVLQPIKMEPLMPTVNWPDPGEIKETFDDFSDFVSNSSWNDTTQSQTSTSQAEKCVVQNDGLDKITDKHKIVSAVKEKSEVQNDTDFDDDFNTFQSALPSKNITPEFNFDSLSSNAYNSIPPQSSLQLTDFNNAFPTMNNVKSEIISANNPARPTEVLSPNLNNCQTAELISNKNPMLANTISYNLLQPVPSNSNLSSSQHQQKSAQILQPLSLESYSQINWPNPGIDLQDLSRFNPVETLQSLKSDLSVGGASKVSSPVHNQKTTINNQVADDDIWGEFVSSKPTKQQPSLPMKSTTFADDDEWSDFVSSPSVKPQNGLNTISLNVHTNSNIQKSNSLNKFPTKKTQMPIDIPSLNYITPKASGQNSFNDRHFQNL